MCKINITKNKYSFEKLFLKNKDKNKRMIVTKKHSNRKEVTGNDNIKIQNTKYNRKSP